MNLLRPNRLSKTVGLCLIGSSLILNGCQHRYPPAEEQQQAVAGGGGSHIHPTWWYFYHAGAAPSSGGVGGGGGTFVSSGRTVSGFKSSTSVASVRGGFGASAHAISAGS